ncbi:MAG: PfaD family polyunsaturated fatty acid/polyketide biosynthesis protein [Myxococcota bacterium]
MPEHSLQKGWYLPAEQRPSTDRSGLLSALQQLHQDIGIVEVDGNLAWICGGAPVLTGPAERPAGTDAVKLLAWTGPLTPADLGDPSFLRAYGVRAPYVAGAMANGIGSEDVVIAMSHAGMLGFFGSAGLPPARIEAAIDRIQREVGAGAYGFNLIHSPNDPRAEQETVDLYLRRGVSVVSASAYMKLTAPLVQYRAAGLSRGADGTIVRQNRLIAKVSRPEVAKHFLRPAPESILEALVRDGRITAEQAELAALVPMADDLTAEADSGGHTDRRPLPVLLPLLLRQRDQIAAELGYADRLDEPVRIGAAGGLGDPAAVAAAFQLGAAYVLTGTVNQACVEAGTSPMVKAMLADAGFADVGMAPAGDMFEQGAEVQVLQRGTLFARRGSRLREWHRRYNSLDELSDAERDELETKILRRPAEDVWAECESFFAERDPEQLDRARKDPRKKMALIFRWYLGLSSRWAIAGQADRRADVQVWCGPAIGAFNAWTEGTFLADPQHRTVATVAANLLCGAAALIRARSLLQQGVDPGAEAHQYPPRPLQA